MCVRIGSARLLRDTAAGARKSDPVSPGNLQSRESEIESESPRESSRVSRESGERDPGEWRCGVDVGAVVHRWQKGAMQSTSRFSLNLIVDFVCFFIGAESSVAQALRVGKVGRFYSSLGSRRVELQLDTATNVRTMSGVSVVIGAGVVGLACARALARKGLEVLVLESQHMIGSGVSSRNSEVIHAGIYYPKGSIKARACVEGKKMLYDYCREREIGHNRCGKLIVATSDEQLGDLQRIQQLAAGNGVDDLRILSVADVADLEPELCCVGALLSPSTGIVDSHSFMLSLQGDIELHGGCVVLNTPITRYKVLQNDASNGGDTTLRVFTGGAEPMEVDCDVLVNAAGLFAPELANISGLAESPEPYFAKGNYYKLEGCSNPFRRLIYPVPEKNTAGLGVHATLDLAGQLKFGPDVEWLSGVRHARDINVDTYKVRG